MASVHHVIVPRLPNRRSIIALGLSILLSWPIAMLALGAFRSTSPLDGGGIWTLSGFSQMAAEVMKTGALWNSLTYAGFTTFFSMGLALTMCCLSERTDVPLHRLITPLMMICATTSTLFYAIGYDLLANPFTGALNVMFRQLTGSPAIFNIESWQGLILVDSLHSASFLYLFLVGPFRNLDRTLEEAALTTGASRAHVFFTITVPMLTPILSGVVLMGIVSGLKSFNIPLILGAPADVSFLTVRILMDLQNAQPPQYGSASALAISLILVITFLLFLQRRLVARRSYLTVTGKSVRQARWKLGVWRWPAGFLLMLYGLMGVVLPLGGLVLASFVPFPGTYHGFSLVNYRALLTNPDMGGVVANTATSAAIAGLAGVALAFGIASLAERMNSKLVHMLRGLTQIQLALPGIIGSLALIWAVTSVPGLRQIYGTIWLLYIAFMLAVLPVSVQIASGAVRQISLDLEAAARVAGSSPLRAWFDVTLRLLLPSVLFAWLLAALTIVGDLDAPLLLSSAGTHTLSIQVYNLFEGSDQSQAAALLTLVLALILAAAALYAGLMRLLSNRRISGVNQ